MRSILCAALVVAVAGAVHGAPAPVIDAKQLDAVFADIRKEDSPGCAVAVVRNGKVAFQKGYGMANLDHRVPITPASIFYIASDSKQFTALCIALLAEQGRVSLADPVTRYIPELPSRVYGAVTLGQLVHHTGGVRDYWGLRELEGVRPEAPLDQAEFLHLIARQGELNFTPGDRFMYSNSGYALLAIVVKRVSGKDLARFAEENIFKPLGMEHTSFGADHMLVLENRAAGYHARGTGYAMDGSTVEPLGDGGVRTSVLDLVRWDQNFYANRLGNRSPRLIELVESPGALNDGGTVPYGFGLALAEYDGLRTITHSGSYAGYQSYMARIPDRKLSVLCLCNSDGPNFSPWVYGKKILDLYLGIQPRAVTTRGVAEQAPTRLTAEELARYTGDYREDDGTAWKLVIRDGKLEADVQGISFALEPLSATHFRAVGAPQPVELFYPDGGPAVSKEIGVQIGSHPRTALKPDVPAKLSAAELAAYRGAYESDELDVTLTVGLRGDELVLARPHAEPETLEPVARDQFKKGRRSLKFSRDSSGSVVEFRLEAEGVTGVRFARKVSP